MAQPRLQQIADLAGVSTATVSRVLNNKKDVSPETRDQVVEALRRLGGGVVEGSLIGLVLPDSTNPFFIELAFKLQDDLQKLGLSLLIVASEGRLDREAALLDQFRALNVAGLLYIGAGSNSEALLNLVGQGGLPVIVLDRRVRAGNLDSAVTSSVNATRAAVALLAAQGHTRIAYLRGLGAAETATARFASFEDAMSHNFLKVDRSLIFSGDYSIQSGQTCADELAGLDVEARPTAILAANDLMAIGLIQRCQQLGIAVPADLSVIGFDGITIGTAIYPALTTIEQPIAELVSATARLMKLRVAQYEKGVAAVTPPESLEFDCSLVQRDSVGPAPR